MSIESNRAKAIESAKGIVQWSSGLPDDVCAEIVSRIIEEFERQGLIASSAPETPEHS